MLSNVILIGKDMKTQISNRKDVIYNVLKSNLQAGFFQSLFKFSDLCHTSET